MIIRHPQRHPLIKVPPDAHCLDGLRRWARSGEFPQQARVALIDGQVLIDLNSERIQSHSKVKSEITFVIESLVRSLDLGECYPDGAWLTNNRAGVSNEPDCMFVSWERLENGLVRLVVDEDDDDGIELVGSPDWVLEVVSPSSVDKDTELLPDAYFRADIPEYWVVDARGETVAFSIFVAEPQGYRAVTSVEGWMMSREFRLQRLQNRLGAWRFKLDVREKKT